MFFEAKKLLDNLEEGKTYLIKGYGKRIEKIGFYPHIISAELVK